MKIKETVSALIIMLTLSIVIGYAFNAGLEKELCRPHYNFTQDQIKEMKLNCK
jgi:hypothetical protein